MHGGEKTKKERRDKLKKDREKRRKEKKTSKISECPTFTLFLRGTIYCGNPLYFIFFFLFRPIRESRNVWPSFIDPGAGGILPGQTKLHAIHTAEHGQRQPSG